MDPPGCVSYSTSGWADAQIQARRVYESVRAAVGPRLWPLVFAVCIEELTVERFANERGRNSGPTMEVLRVALDMVGDALGLPE